MIGNEAMVLRPTGSSARTFKTRKRQETWALLSFKVRSRCAKLEAPERVLRARGMTLAQMWPFSVATSRSFLALLRRRGSGISHPAFRLSALHVDQGPAYGNLGFERHNL